MGSKNFWIRRIGRSPAHGSFAAAVASALATNPSASLPQALGNWGETRGAYRLLSDPALSYEDLLQPHWNQVYGEAADRSRTLLLADTTEFDFTTHQALKGRGPIGNSRENIGFSLHTVLAMDPQTQEILGCLTLEPFVRKLAPAGETKAQRKKRERESQVWEQSVQRIGRVPENCQWIYVGDSGSDVYTFWQTCEDLGYDFVLRIAASIVMWLFLNGKSLRSLSKPISKRWFVLFLLSMLTCSLFPLSVGDRNAKRFCRWPFNRYACSRLRTGLA